MKEISRIAFNPRKLLAVAMITSLVFVIGAASVSADDKNLVKVHADGQQYLVSVNDTSVKEVLQSLDINLLQADLVEPELQTVVSETPFNINVYRAQTAVIVDGDQRTTVLTSHSSGKDIAEDAGLKINPKDEFSVERVDNFLEEQLIGLKVEVNRSTPFTVNLFGEELTKYTHKATFGEALADVGIDASEADLIQPALDTKLTANAKIDLYKEGITEVTEEEVIEFTSTTVENDQLETGASQVVTEGENGLEKVTYEVLLRNGQEISRNRVSSEVIKEATQQVTELGPRPVPVAGSLNSVHIDSAQKAAWMTAAGIPESQWGYVDSIVSRESSWNPNAVNPSSGACGLGQQLPCGKWAGAWNDPVAALRAQYKYVNERYGGYAQATAFWNANYWY